jgi:hypothetical protein
MSSNDEKLRTLLRAEAERVIDSLLADARAASEMSLEEILETTRAAGRNFRAVLTKALVEAAAEADTLQLLPLCPECDVKRLTNGNQDNVAHTLAGKTIPRRSYFRCQNCGRAVFPQGWALGAASST